MRFSLCEIREFSDFYSLQYALLTEAKMLPVVIFRCPGRGGDLEKGYGDVRP